MSLANLREVIKDISMSEVIIDIILRLHTNEQLNTGQGFVKNGQYLRNAV